MNYNAYPLQFEPILKDKIWGGRKLQSLLNKPSTSKHCGESWELSAVDGDVSVVANGQYRGQSLTALIDQFGDAILGTAVAGRFGSQFPLLFKFIDAHEDLSIQVHPNDELAQKRHNAKGKTEMWYIMQADPGARLTIGFNNPSNSEQYLEHLNDKSLPEILKTFEAKQGDVYFLETGTVHAIGAGILLAEIQQTSDITYRIYDYDRPDANGEKRELHIDLALDAITYQPADTVRPYSRKVNQANEVVASLYFNTKYIPLDGEMSARGKQSSFTVYMCVEGDFSLIHDNCKYDYKKGETVLIPATMGEYQLHGKASLLEICI